MRKLAGAVATACILSIALPAHAGGASDAMSYISSGSTSMSNSKRDVFVGGSMRMFVPQSRTQFVSITPPSFSAGCSGIDAAFGGISFINGDQLKQMVKNIMAASPGYALDLAIRTLCPICSDVMQKIRDLANWANSMAIDSCGAAQSLVNTIAEGGASLAGAEDPAAAIASRQQQGGKFFQDACKLAESGQAAWYEQTACAAANFEDGIGAKIKTWVSGVNSGKSWQQLTADDKAQIDVAATAANQTYAGLLAYGLTDMDAVNLLMSVFGTSYTGEEGESESMPGWGSVIFPDMGENDRQGINMTETAIDTLVYVLLVGLDGKIDPSTVGPELTALFEDVEQELNFNGARIKDLPYYRCADVGSTASRAGPGDYLKCRGDNLQQFTLDDDEAKANKYLDENGFMVMVAQELVEAADRMAKGQGLETTQLALINAAPLPVYRMLRVAAIYPEAGKSLIKSYSKLIALMLIRSQFVNGMNPDEMTPAQWDSMMKFRDMMNIAVQKIAASIDTKQKSTLDAEITMINNLQGVLRTVDRLIAEKAVMTGAAGATMFSRTAMPSGPTPTGSP
jgi:hypothetical protein